tara:strand:- start:24 stop:323 length:300 start_codon:yes stop_codon:yes gene_type:complete
MTAASKEGAVGIQQKAPANGFATKQHAEPHEIAVGQCQLNRPAEFAHAGFGLDHVALLLVAAGTPDHALVSDLGYAFDRRFAMTLTGMDGKGYMRRPFV